MPLRDYQQAAHDAAISWVKKSVEPCLIEAATGAGKSHIIAAIAKTIHSISGGKHILCLAPSAELVLQNREKYLATGEPASIFSASAGSKCLKHPVVFGTPGTVKNKISKFGDRFALVVIDECHGITPTIRKIIFAMQIENPKLRIVGLSATPYRMGSGYIYRMDEDGKPMPEENAIDPYFLSKVYSIGANDLIDRRFLTPPVIGAINVESYETIDMTVSSAGKFNKGDIDRAYHGHGRKTSAIIADVIAQSAKKKGVMIFAATIQHAEECFASLPPEISALITSNTNKKDRAKILKAFKRKEIKYLVNVSVLTTGFDAPHVDVIAILRATESAGLLQQIIGRGLRIDDGKEECLVLDYANNMERHSPDGDVFSPLVKGYQSSKEKAEIKAICPSCNIQNIFSARDNDAGLSIDHHGYFVDIDGNRIHTEFGDMSAHYGRRCQAMHPVGNGQFIQCDYRWTHKICPDEDCAEENDIAARYCRVCKQEIVDPNEKLIADFKKLKKDPTKTQTDLVLSMDQMHTVSQKGNECIRVSFKTEYRTFTTWIMKNPKFPSALYAKESWIANTDNGRVKPVTVTYEKNPNNGMFSVVAYNKPHDEAPPIEDTKMA